MLKPDRRVKRTRELLQQALIDLVSERGYAAITIQDIVDRANVGRTTFYLHFNGKDDLFMSCHAAVVSQFHFWPRSFSREHLLSPQTPPEMIGAFRHMAEARAQLYPIFHGQDNQLILKRIRTRSAQEIEACLRASFTAAESAVPFDVLANYLAGAQIAMVQWWLEQRPHHPPEALAQAFHRL